MNQRFVTFFGITIIVLLMQTYCSYAQTNNIPDSVITAYDTVYYNPDTIKTTRVDTVFEYIEEATKDIATTKMADFCFLVGPHVALGISHYSSGYNKTSMYGEMNVQGMYVYNRVFASIGIAFTTPEKINVEYGKDVKTLHHWIDTIKTVQDSYIEIIGKDTFQRQSIITTFLPKTDTIHSDTIYSHKNGYRFINIPIVCGYIFKQKKTWYGCGIGPNVRLTLIDATNKLIIGDSSFVSERSYIKKITIDVNGILFVKRKISNKIWANVQFNCSIPLSSSNNGYNSKMYRQSYCLSVGFEYFFKK